MEPIADASRLHRDLDLNLIQNEVKLYNLKQVEHTERIHVIINVFGCVWSNQVLAWRFPVSVYVILHFS